MSPMFKSPQGDEASSPPLKSSSGVNENLCVCISKPKKPSLTAEPLCHLNLTPLSRPSADEVSFANSITGQLMLL